MTFRVRGALTWHLGNLGGKGRETGSESSKFLWKDCLGCCIKRGGVIDSGGGGWERVKNVWKEAVGQGSSLKLPHAQAKSLRGIFDSRASSAAPQATLSKSSPSLPPSPRFLASHTLFLQSSYLLLIYHVIGMFILFTLCFFPQEQGVLNLEAIDILDHVTVCCWELSWAFWDVLAASLASPPTRCQ